MPEEKRAEPERTRVVYDRLAAGYDRALGPLERWFLSSLRAQALSALPAESSVLEVGAGTGLNFRFYPRAACGVASELSHAMIEIAAGKERPQRVHLVQNKAERLPFRAASFDAAFATLVFCSVASPADAFLELRRVVRPGGSVLLLEHVRPDGLLLGWLFDALSVLTVWLFDDHFNRRTADEARRAGLKLVRVQSRFLGIIQLIECRV